jgi:hypothetical protein
LIVTQDLLAAVDLAITVVNLSNIAIEAVEEFLPTFDPGSQLLDPETTPTPGKVVAPEAAPGQAPLGGRRRLIANVSDSGNTLTGLVFPTDLHML